MNQNRPVESPFLQQQQVRLSFGTLLILLLMVVAAGVSLLLYWAVHVPAITSEVNAWLGRSAPVVDPKQARRSQLYFALIVYSAPLALGIFVHTLHFAINAIAKQMSQEQEDDEQFRME